MRIPNSWIKIREIFPRVFFRECSICGMLIKKEYIWKFKTNSSSINKLRSFGDYYKVIYLCKECCPNQGDIFNYLNIDEEFYHIK